jgi:hypothetical protein
VRGGLLTAALLLAPPFAAGCEKKAESPPAARTMPVDPDTPANLEKPDKARVTVDLASVRAAVKRSQQIEGVVPASLSAVGVGLSYPEDLVYDASTGEVSSKTYPSL